MSSEFESSAFVELDVLRSSDGIKGIISQRKATGVITFCIVKEFTQDGDTRTTSFVPEAMIDSYEAMLVLVRRRIRELRDTGAAAPVRPRKVAGDRR